MKKIIILLIFSFLAISLLLFFMQINSSKNSMSSISGDYYLTNNIKDFNIPNVVTSIVTQYRSYDTVGEITILFLSIIGIFMLVKSIGFSEIDKLFEKPGTIVHTAALILFPIIMLFGSYIIINGHLSPGGGFQGGAIIGSGMLLLFLAGNKKELNKTATHIVESISVSIILLIGLLGIYYLNGFLANFIYSLGTFGSIISGGIIPIIYILIGVKVTIEFFHLSEYLLRS